MTTYLTARTRQGFSVRVRARALVVGLAVTAALLLLAVLSMATGDFPVSPPDVVRAVLGQGDPGTAFVVQRLRAPRMLLAVLVGAAFGVSGAVFQSLTGNPLGSPDVIGFTAGAATGGIMSILLGAGSQGEIALWSVVGGLITGVAVYGLAYRNGVQAFRLVLVGLGMAYSVFAVNSYLLSRASVSDGLEAERWLLGTVSGADWTAVTFLGLSLAVLLPLVLMLARPLNAMEVGDDAGRELGVRVQLYRPVIAFGGVALAAVGTAAAGPVSFVALAAPQIGRRLTRSPGANLVVSALTGAALLLAADLAGQRLFSTGMPVGLVTGLIGGGYLAWLLVTSRRTT